MTWPLAFYRLAGSLGTPLLGAALKRRAKRGKEVASRLNERWARELPPRPEGQLIWLHGASLGECLLLIGVAERLRSNDPGLRFLFTSQTRTAAELIARRTADWPDGTAQHQFAPLDTPASAERFIAHWRPMLGVFAEGEIWPTLIFEAKRQGTQLALINARMTQKSLQGWARIEKTSREIFAAFDLILAADRRTAAGLSDLAGRQVETAGNLKSALPTPKPDTAELADWQADFASESGCLLAASTHPGEEALVLEAWKALRPRPKLIIAPRHPERGDEVEALIRDAGEACHRRSKGAQPHEVTDILLADTIGEMGLWYELCDGVYLGGGHAHGVGGHNPLEPVRLGKPVLTGPDVANFEDVMTDLERDGALCFVESAQALSAAWPPRAIPAATLAGLEASADAPMRLTLERLQALIPAGERAQ